MHVALNDALIEEFIHDSSYVIYSNGAIYTYKDRGGWDSPFLRVMIQKNRHGYEYVNYKSKKLSVHRIIYHKFKGILNPFLVINHIDGNPGNNNVNNLELVSQKDNCLHSYWVLGNPAPDAKTNHKLSFNIANQIRKKANSGTKSSDLAKEYGVSKSSISYVLNKKTWIKDDKC